MQHDTGRHQQHLPSGQLQLLHPRAPAHALTVRRENLPKADGNTGENN